MCQGLCRVLGRDGADGGRQAPNKTPSAGGQRLHQDAGGYSALAGDGEMIKEGSSEEVMLEVGFEGRTRIFQSDQREEGKASEARHKRWE